MVVASGGVLKPWLARGKKPGSGRKRGGSFLRTFLVSMRPVRKSGRKVDRRIFLFTDNDDPFAHVDPLTRADMRRLTIQRAKVWR